MNWKVFREGNRMRCIKFMKKLLKITKNLKQRQKYRKEDKSKELKIKMKK